MPVQRALVCAVAVSWCCGSRTVAVTVAVAVAVSVFTAGVRLCKDELVCRMRHVLWRCPPRVCGCVRTNRCACVHRGEDG